jgi:hypothetical protein
MNCLTVLPKELLLKIFSFLPINEIVLNISVVSKEIHTVLISHEFFLQLLKQNGFFTPILKKETNKKFYNSISSFYRFIFRPIEMTKQTILSVSPFSVCNFSKEDNSDLILKKLNEKLVENIELPPSFQMFCILCEKWGGKFEDDFKFKGSNIFENFKCILEENDPSIEFLEIASWGNDGFYLCLNSNQNFGKIKTFSSGKASSGFSILNFHEIIRDIFKHIEVRSKEYDLEEYSDIDTGYDGLDFLSLRKFVKKMKFEEK